MPKHKDFGTDDFSNERARAFVRSRAQAVFRGEVWLLTRPEFFRFWQSPELWNQRGRQADCLVLTRKDYDLPWDTDNCCIITRHNQILTKTAIRFGRPFEKFYKERIDYEPYV